MKQAIITVLPNGCCVSDHYRNKDGYARLKWMGRVTGLHTAMYETLHGPLPKGMVVRHTCDNRACCNPNHLVLGTHAQNVADRVARGRSARGERSGRAKLTEDQVLAILTSDEPHVVLARRYGVAPAIPRRIRAGKIWTHLTASVA